METVEPAPTSSVADSEDWDSECYTEAEIQAAYYQLSLPLECIEIVDTMDKYNSCMEHLTKVNKQ